MNKVLQPLGYQGSTNFVSHGSADFASAVDHAHILRKAVADCGLKGFYALRPDDKSSKGLVPVVYVCEAADEATARNIHKLVWNQNVVPFLLVLTPNHARLYAAFQYEEGNPDKGTVTACVPFNEIAECLKDIQADAIDSGKVWEALGKFVTPETRVDWQLLDHLRQLDDILLKTGLDHDTSHGLIGKFVYLRYLRDRDILSDRKLEKWDIPPDSVFTRDATLKAFWTVDEQLDAWLNGAVFPLAAKKSAIKSEHLKKVAGVFFGDDPEGQLHLDFGAYDFSYIPTELLSCIYEQFLHYPSPKAKMSRGKEVGAYYTPVPLINFVLTEMDEKRPLEDGMKMLDPACGSGAFLVQCYRRLIELRKSSSGESKLRPTELRELLVDHVFGVERDGDACQIAELSLVLTLLDNVEPPDLENNPRFRLPPLHNCNIFQADFFDPQSAFSRFSKNVSFDWIVGNPPWKPLSGAGVSIEDQNALQWMRGNLTECPVGGNQIAEAFAWKVLQHITPRGVIGLVLPAMTLFKGESTGFRRKLFSEKSVWCVANFSNLAYVLFAGRAQRAAAVFFYAPEEPETDGTIQTYAPFVINQIANQPTAAGKHKTTWSIVVNADEQREIPVEEAASGDMLPWKIAMWGSGRDQKLLASIQGQFPSLANYCAESRLKVHQGFETRSKGQAGVEYTPEIVGKQAVASSKLRNCGRIFHIPASALGEINPESAYLRIRGGRAGLEVSRPPHILVDASRRFAVYSSRFLAIPARQIGIAGPVGTEVVLKVLSLYLSSDFATYHQFFTCPEWGIDASIATLHALKALPVPMNCLNSAGLDDWARLHTHLVESSKAAEQGLFGEGDAERGELTPKLRELNKRVFDLLEMRTRDRRVITDFVNVRMQLMKGKVTKPAVRQATESEVEAYVATLKEELDGFLGPGLHTHDVTAFLGESVGVAHVDLVSAGCGGGARVSRMSATTTKELGRLQAMLSRKHSQWLYFNRNLRLYDGRHTYIFKPIQRVHWTMTQAMLDADELIADTLSST